MKISKKILIICFFISSNLLFSQVLKNDIAYSCWFFPESEKPSSHTRKTEFVYGQLAKSEQNLYFNTIFKDENKSYRHEFEQLNISNLKKWKIDSTKMMFHYLRREFDSNFVINSMYRFCTNNFYFVLNAKQNNRDKFIWKIIEFNNKNNKISNIYSSGTFSNCSVGNLVELNNCLYFAVNNFKTDSCMLLKKSYIDAKIEIVFHARGKINAIENWNSALVIGGIFNLKNLDFNGRNLIKYNGVKFENIDGQLFHEIKIIKKSTNYLYLSSSTATDIDKEHPISRIDRIDLNGKWEQISNKNLDFEFENLDLNDDFIVGCARVYDLKRKDYTILVKMLNIKNQVSGWTNNLSDFRCLDLKYPISIALFKSTFFIAGNFSKEKEGFIIAGMNILKQAPRIDLISHPNSSILSFRPENNTQYTWLYQNEKRNRWEQLGGSQTYYTPTLDGIYKISCTNLFSSCMTIFSDSLSIKNLVKPDSVKSAPVKYILQAWVKCADLSAQKSIRIAESYEFFSNGPIIDGWQRIEGVFESTNDVTQLATTIRYIKTGTSPAFFDDVRVFAFNGQMKSFVYDPQSLRLVAILDEQNYATFYEYDAEGKLIRVKKETERGVMTIQESLYGIPQNIDDVISK